MGVARHLRTGFGRPHRTTCMIALPPSHVASVRIVARPADSSGSHIFAIGDRR
jgi:hypothetical protein